MAVRCKKRRNCRKERVKIDGGIPTATVYEILAMRNAPVKIRLYSASADCTGRMTGKNRGGDYDEVYLSE